MNTDQIILIGIVLGAVMYNVAFDLRPSYMSTWHLPWLIGLSLAHGWLVTAFCDTLFGPLPHVGRIALFAVDACTHLWIVGVADDMQHHGRW